MRSRITAGLDIGITATAKQIALIGPGWHHLDSYRRNEGSAISNFYSFDDYLNPLIPRPSSEGLRRNAFPRP